MHVTGRCHCGAIAFEAEIDERDVSICHCTDCQRLTGTAFRVSAPAPAASFRVVSGEPRIYVKVADSGARRAQGFCGDCGTPLFATTADREPEVYGVRVGTLEQRAALAPSHQIWRRSALQWMPEMPELTTSDRDD